MLLCLCCCVLCVLLCAVRIVLRETVQLGRNARATSAAELAVGHPRLTLALLVTWVVLADDHDVAVATDHAAVLAHGLDAGGDLHCSLLSLSSYRFDTSPTRPLLSSSPLPGLRYL